MVSSSSDAAVGAVELDGAVRLMRALRIAEAAIFSWQVGKLAVCSP
jgi:hypothetical protein